jgi:hypothetical protein
VLGPLLFVIFINDLEDSVEGLLDILKKFADDTKLGQEVTKEEDRDRLQQALDESCQWAERWGMQFNVSKCKVMHMGTSNPGYQYHMGGQALETTDEERDIGVMITASLKPSAQCAKAAKTAQAVLGQLARAFHYRDRHVFMRLYKYVRPHLEFSTQAWSPWTEGDKACLEKVQERAVRMVSGLKSDDYSERLSELGLPTLEERRHQADMAMVHKILCGRGSLDSNQWFERAADSVRATRSSANPLNLKVRQGRLEIRRNFFSNRVVNSWNDIPSDIRGTVRSENFQRKYKQLRASR